MAGTAMMVDSLILSRKCWFAPSLCNRPKALLPPPPPPTHAQAHAHAHKQVKGLQPLHDTYKCMSGRAVHHFHKAGPQPVEVSYTKSKCNARQGRQIGLARRHQRNKAFTCRPLLPKEYHEGVCSRKCSKRHLIPMVAKPKLKGRGSHSAPTTSVRSTTVNPRRAVLVSAQWLLACLTCLGCCSWFMPSQVRFTTSSSANI